VCLVLCLVLLVQKVGITDPAVSACVQLILAHTSFRKRQIVDNQELSYYLHILLHRQHALPSMYLPVRLPSHCTGHVGKPTLRLPAHENHSLVKNPRPERTALRLRASSAEDHPSSNPLEVLRCTTDPRARAKLLQELDQNWSRCTAEYRPSDVESFIIKQLGVTQYNVMMVAVQTPALVSYSVPDQLQPAIKTLKDANIEPETIWFLLSKCHHLLADPLSLQRWLDFLSAYKLTNRDISQFLQRAPPRLFTEGTLAQAAFVVALLKSLGLKDDIIGSRVVCLRPELLLRDVEAQVQPVISQLLSLGLEVRDVGHMAAVYPELLLRSAEEEVAPFIAYLRQLGCLTSQLAALLFEHPHLLQFTPQVAFGQRLEMLQQLDIGASELDTMVKRCTRFLTVKGGIDEPLAALRGQGLAAEAIKAMVVRCPQILASKEGEVDAKFKFLREDVGLGDEVAGFVVERPYVLACSLMQVLGPRYSFVSAQDKFKAALVGSDGQLDWFSLVSGGDEQLCELLGAGLNEYASFRAQWEEAFGERLSRDAAQEFQDELRKLGIYEGS
jgi:mTERF domain-containing protein